MTGAFAAAGVLAALALPAAARAADSLHPGGIIVPGSALTVGVSGGGGYAGSIQARFSGTGSPLYWGDQTHSGAPVPPNLNDETAAMFALQTPSGVYSPIFPGYLGSPQPFTQTSAPVRTGTGTVVDPWTVTSAFDATSSLHITQTVTHVDGTTEFLGTWAVQNTGGASVNLKAFEGGDLYVNENDNGVGSLVGTSPNRIVQSIATDGTTAELIEQPSAPWSHYFTGDNGSFYWAVAVDNFTHLPDTADATMRDSGEASEWDFTLAAGATNTVSVMWHFNQPSPPMAPVVANAPASSTTETSAAPTFSPQPGDTQLVSYECSLDSGAYVACTAPASHAGLGDGPHTFSVRGVSSAGRVGPSTTVAWTIGTPTPRATPDAPAEALADAAPTAPTAPTAPAACVSVRAMRLHWTVPDRSRLGAFKVTANGRPIATLAATRRAYTLSLRGRAAQKVTVRVSARTRAGARFGTTRVYTTCAEQQKPSTLETLRVLPMR